jgi:septal ring factor EnvC (AmiA/AmiB activator)
VATRKRKASFSKHKARSYLYSNPKTGKERAGSQIKGPGKRLQQPDRGQEKANAKGEQRDCRRDQEGPGPGKERGAGQGQGRESKAPGRSRKDVADNNAATSPNVKSIVPKETKPASSPSVLLGSAEDLKLNANFIGNRGSLPWPVDKGYMIMRFGPQKLDIGVTVDNPGITIGSDIGAPVKALFDGEVSSVTNIDNMQLVVIKHGAYFTTYSNLSGVTVSRGQSVHTGQTLGRVAPNDEGTGSIDLIISNEKGNLNPEGWLRRR